MGREARAIFIMSTGRCSTQFLARLLALGQPAARVVHEGVGPNYQPARVFRQGGFEDVIAQTHQLPRHFAEIEALLAAGQSFIDTGWPAYAWGPYFARRFGPAFRFAHLLRNPFAVAASMSTHLLLDDREDRLSKHGVIRPHHPAARFGRFAEAYGRFSRFERGLYHWLEVNTYLAEQHQEPGFMGLYRFEEMYTGATPTVKKLWVACGFRAGSYQDLPPYDKYNGPAPPVTPPNGELVELVQALALQLGYDEALLHHWADISFLNAHYQTPRLNRL